MDGFASGAGQRRGSAQRQRRRITAEDLLRFQWVSDPQISPDGSHVLFSHKRVGEKNQYETNLWIVRTDAADPPRPFTSGGRDSHGRWSPDGSRIAFISAREKKQPQLYLIDHAAGGEARKLTSFPEGSIAGFKWSPRGDVVAVSFREQGPQWTEQAKKEREAKGLSTPPRVIDDWWYRLDGDGYFDAQRYKLYLVDVATGAHRLVYDKDTLGVFDFDLSPDGRQIVISTNRNRKAMIRDWKTELLRLNVATGKLTPIPNLPDGMKWCPRWSPDGRSIAYAGRIGREETYITENVQLFVCNAKSGRPRNLTGHEDYCLMAIGISDASEANFGVKLQWAPDSRRIFTQIGWHGETHVASVAADAEHPSMRFHTSGRAVHQMGNISADGALMALTRGSTTTLDELCAARLGNSAQSRAAIKQLTNLNGPLLDELDLVSPEEHWVQSEDGQQVHVWTLKPQGYKPHRKHPAILEIHGGPHAQYGVGLFHEFQLLAANGYVVVYSNPRGSKGYGRDHCAAIRGSWGGKDWADIQAVITFMQSRKDIDARRMGVMGGSYGGYMTNWVIGHTDAFAGAITDRCVANLVSMQGTSDFTSEPGRYWPGNAWDKPEKLWEMSPLRYMRKVTTPTLIIHSEGDLRCNIEQAEQVFTALKLNNVPTRLIRYPRETSHGLSRGGPPDLRLHRLGQILDWWEKWLAPKRTRAQTLTRQRRQ